MVLMHVENLSNPFKSLYLQDTDQEQVFILAEKGRKQLKQPRAPS